MNEKTKKRMEERHTEIIEKQNEIAKTEIETGKEVATKNEEVHEKKIQHLSELEKSNLGMQKNMFTLLKIRNSGYNGIAMNNHIEEIETISNNIENSYGQCITYFGKGFKWNEKQIKRARKEFEDLESLINNLKRSLVTTGSRLTELENDEKAEKLAETIKEMRAKLFLLGNCVSKFCGTLKTEIKGDFIWDQEDINELGKIMSELNQILFPHFATMNGKLISHLERPLLNDSDSSEQKKIEN
uniref:Uncharacterized protein n=1 Tax=Caenorhabditis tropicalis TaxID=1561998 RepID=A0A1I7U839_9PELO